MPHRNHEPPGVVKDPLSGTCREAKHAQYSCSIFQICGKTGHTFVRVPKFLTERRLAAARVGLSMEVSKELGPVEAVPTAVLGNLTIIVELLRKS